MRVVRRLHLKAADLVSLTRMLEQDEPVVVPISDVFDLHSFAPRDVKSAVVAYLEEAHRLGFSVVRIIHGRGIGVQRETVRQILEQTPFIGAFSDAPAEAGGWGATVAELSRAFESPQGSRAGSADPRIRRKQFR